MNNNSTDQFNFVVGVFGFTITIVSTALCCRAYLPGAQMKILDELLKETRSIYEKADADDLFPTDNFRKSSLTTLARMEESSALLRESAYNATTTVQEYLALFKGLSRKIMYLADRVKDLRACLISTSEKKRRRRQMGNDRRSVHLSDSSTVDTSMSWLTSIDSSFDSESELTSESQEVDLRSDTRQGQSASCPPALDESDQPVNFLKESVARLGEGNHQGADQGDAVSGDNLSRSSTLVDRQPRGMFYETLDRFRGWMSIHLNKGTQDAPPHCDQDIARLPV